MQLSFYLDLIKQMTIGNYRGRKILAKPIFVIAVIESIAKGKITENRLFYDDLIEEYTHVYHMYIGKNVTPMHKPFYYMQHDGFWHIQYLNIPVAINSVRSVRDNIEYAYLDTALWTLLQDKEARKNIKDEIVRFFKLDESN